MTRPVADPIDMQTFQDAVHRWFWEATNIETIWRRQSNVQPKYPYATLMITDGPNPVSPVWEDRYETDLDRPAGEEVKITVCVPCHFTVSCQSYVGRPDGKDPDYDAQNYMNKAQSSLMLPSVLAMLREKEISVVRPGSVQNIGLLVEDAFESRANMDVVFGASLSLDDYVGYIKTVQVISESLGIDEIIGL